MKKLFKKLFKKPEKETTVELICNILSCWLIIVGTCLIVDAQFNFQIGIVPILWQTLATVVALFLFTRQWWIPVIYFGILVPVFFLSISLSGDIYSFFESFVSFVSWWFASMPINSKWYSDQGFYLVHTIINIGISILFFSVYRITKRASAVALLAGVFIIINYAGGHIKYDVIATLFFVAGIFPLIAGDKFQKVKLPDFRNVFGVLGKKWLFVVTSTIFAAAVSLMSLGISSIVNGSIRNRVCSDIVADIQTATNVFVDEQKKLNISLFDLGLVTNSTYVGGSLYDIEPAVLAVTDFTETALVKVTSFDTFDGLNWVNSFEKSYRINGIWKDEENEFLSSRLANNEEFASAVENIGYKTKIKIHLNTESFFLPTIGQVWGFEEHTPTENPVLFDERGRFFSYYGVDKKYSYTIESLIYNTKQKVLSKQIKSINSRFDASEDPLYDIESEFYKKYTKDIIALPKKLKKDIKKLNIEDESHYNKAVAICNYFSAKNGYVYTDKPSIFYKGDNLVDALYKTKKGHCMYYTAAMIAITRSVGIPSRLAAGYKTVPSSDGKIQVIDKSSPYAWVECYIPNIGWMAFDPTPQKAANHNYSNSQNNNKKPEKPKVEEEVEHKKLNDKQEKEKVFTKKVVLNVSLITSLFVIALLLLYVVLNTMFSQKFYQIRFVRKRFKKKEKQTEFYYYDILRQLSWLGFRFKRGETLNELIARAKSVIGDSDTIKNGIKVIEAQYYGDITPTDDDINAVFQARKMLEEILRAKNYVVVYIIKRRLLLPVFYINKKRLKFK